MYERSYFFLFFPRRCTVVELLISREKEPSKFVEPMLYVFLIYGIISISRAVTFLIRRDALRSFFPHDVVTGNERNKSNNFSSDFPRLGRIKFTVRSRGEEENRENSHVVVRSLHCSRFLKNGRC